MFLRIIALKENRIFYKQHRKYNVMALSVEEKWEGKTLPWNIGNRVAGGGRCLLGEMVMLFGGPVGIALGTPFFIEGMGDVLTGKHHYIPSRVYKKLIRKGWKEKCYGEEDFEDEPTNL